MTAINSVIARNASANLVRLLGSGFVALSLPALLARWLPSDTYSAWALLLQWTAYLSFLDFGMQTAVSTFIARANELANSDERNGISSTAFTLLSIASIVGLMLVGIASWQLPHVFPEMPRQLQDQARTALLVMGGSFVLGLPVSVIHATFIGLQRNQVPTFLILVNRATMAGLVALAAHQHWGLPAMGVAVAVANLFSYAATYVAWQRLAPYIKIRISLARRDDFKQISGYCAATSVWLLGMLMVSGLDLTIVGIFDYSATAYYAVAATLTNFLSQAQGAILSAWLPASAVLAARGDDKGLGFMLVSSTRYGMLVLLAMALPLLLASNSVLSVWVGTSYAARSTVLLQVLLVANVVRLCALPYATLLLGTGQHRKGMLSPLGEGITNVGASILGGYLLGAIGVAIGTLIGSFVGVALHVLYNMPRTSLIAVDRHLLLRHGVLRPMLCAAPMVLLLLSQFVTSRGSSSALLLVIAFAGNAFLFWNYGLLSSERQQLAEVIHLR